MKFVYLLPLAIAVIACNTSDNKINKFSDPIIQQIADYKDKRMSDSLYQFLDAKKTIYRSEAALAFASIQDSSAIEKLEPLLQDSEEDVRLNAAFAIGQTYASKSADILRKALSEEKSENVKAVLLESLGKVARPLLSSDIEEHHSAAAAWAIYRAGLNNQADTSLNKIALQFLQSNDIDAQLGAAHFLSRSARNIEQHFEELINTIANNQSLEVKMALIYSLRKIKTDSCLSYLSSIIKEKSDYRLRVNAIRALLAFPFDKSKKELFDAITDKNVHVAVTAAEVILANGDDKSWIEIANLPARVNNWRIAALSYQAAMKIKPDVSSLRKEIEGKINSSTNNYEKSALITALRYSYESLPFVTEIQRTDTSKVIQSATAGVVASLSRIKTLNNLQKQRLAETFTIGLNTDDPGVVGTIASIIADSTLGFKDVFKDIELLKQSREKLLAYEHSEVIESVEKAIAHLEGKKAILHENVYNHPIDWDFVKTIPLDQVAVIKTNRGNIRLHLLVEEAPGSVANFITLAKHDYFDHKYFHRVVPNFVIQGGCKRGDGSGGEDYTIRSEFSMRKYKTGSVGMASAGKNTEGTQWFITHSPTPHLDGNYTIFAEVLDGIDAVHLIEVGDKILDVEIVEQKK